ncbi:cupin domain-containing protein [Humibacillus xanthopallidus]|uniref:Cupin superfamily protein n=1 Tax=Humibacillus xanthopallidus TaxID=412689 RepID=A0A543HUT8_9MICO|nr:cupin domain-containing protein [Humibacillus xanthopallidus]TQM62044.1 cupin superfamily protein [Humibacillus xanthopallidus]
MTAGTTSRVPTQLRGRPALQRLVPVDAAEFAADTWARSPLVTRAADLPGGLSELFGESAVDELVSRRGLRAPFLRVARDGQTLGDREFTQGGGVGATVADQVSDDKLLRLFAAGATIVLQGLHRTWGPLIDFTQQLADELGHPVQANAYVTPRQSTGFSDHYDVHDVFVLQVGGEKRWRLRPPVHPAPLRDEPWTDHRAEVAQASAAEPAFEFTLRPGDVLYLPRGWVHSATALGGVSTHLTLGIHVWTRRHLADALVTSALAAVSRDEQVRASLTPSPEGFGHGALATDIELVREALIRALQEVEPDSVTDALETKVRAAQRPSPLGPLAQLAAAEALTGETCLRLRPYVDARLVPLDDGHAVLTSRLPAFEVEARDVGTVVALVDGGVLRADMVGVDLARRLMLAGLAVPED